MWPGDRFAEEEDVWCMMPEDKAEESGSSGKGKEGSEYAKQETERAQGHPV